MALTGTTLPFSTQGHFLKAFRYECAVASSSVSHAGTVGAGKEYLHVTSLI